VVVVPVITVQTSYSEELLHRSQGLDALRALGHYKLMRHLEPGSIASSIRSMRLSHEVDRKASLSVDETSDPADQSFLLIVRIRRFVTARF
jgi:hypothetical protein